MKVLDIKSRLLMPTTMTFLPSQAFRTMDSKGNGIITRAELRETLSRFQIPIEAEEFKKLWSR